MAVGSSFIGYRASRGVSKQPTVERSSVDGEYKFCDRTNCKLFQLGTVVKKVNTNTLCLLESISTFPILIIM